jgi:hypothetical protein
LSFGDSCAKGGYAAGVDGSVATGEAYDGEREQLVGGGYGGGFAPGSDVGEEPWWIAADGEVAYACQGVAGVEGAVALVEEGEMAGDVARSFDGAEGAVEFAFDEQTRGAGLDAGKAAADLFVGFAGLEGFVGWFFEEREGAGVGGELDLRGAEFCEEGVDGAYVVDVSVGEEDAADWGAEGFGGGEDVVGGVGEVGVDEGEAVGLADEVAVDEADACELVAVGGDWGRLHGGFDDEGAGEDVEMQKVGFADGRLIRQPP